MHSLERLKWAADTQLSEIWGCCESIVLLLPILLNKFISASDSFSQSPGQLADIVNRICFNRTVNKIYGCCNLQHSDHGILLKTHVPFSYSEISPFGNIWSPFSFGDAENSIINVEKLKSILVICTCFAFPCHVLLYSASSVQKFILFHRAEFKSIVNFQHMCCAGPGFDLPGAIFPS